MTPTERLEAAAAFYDQIAPGCDDHIGVELVATARLFRAIVSDLSVFAAPSELRWATETDTIKAALDLADAILAGSVGVSDKEAGNDA